MDTKNKYKTKHSEELLDYLKTVEGRHITVSDVCDFFKAQGKSIGTTTVYRQLERMVDEGVVNKYTIDIGTPACFEYNNPDAHCSGDATCYHCKCSKCGRLIHMQCEEIDEFRKHMLSEHGFELDPVRTVFYGLCEFCREPEKAGE